MREPSGDQDGLENEAEPSVTRRGSLPAASGPTSVMYRSFSALRSQPAARPAANTMQVPSGDQEGAPCSYGPSVTGAAGADPSTGTTHTWVGRSMIHPTESSRVYRRSILRGRRAASSSPVS
jgi:hypothetical protein